MSAKGRRILVLSPWPMLYAMESGGGTPVLTDLIETLVAGGFSVELVVPEPTGGQSDDVLGIPEHRVAPLRPATTLAGRLLAHLAFNLRVARRTVSIARRDQRPAAIYALSALTIPAAALAGIVLRRPSVGSLFGTFLYPYLGRWGSLARNFEELIAFKMPLSRLVVLNDGTRGDGVAAWLRVPEKRLRFWMHGLDFAAVDDAVGARDIRPKLGLPPEAPLIVSASRLVPWKRIDRTIEAFARVRSTHPDAVLAIAGSGPERPRLERLAATCGVADRVVFTGPLSRRDSIRLAASADIVCCLYDLSNVGVSLLEALACGTAVVVGDAGGTRDFVEDGVTGLVVGTDDLAAAAAATALLLDDRALRDRLGDAARRRARERFLTRAGRRQLELDMLTEIAAPPKT